MERSRTQHQRNVYLFSHNGSIIFLIFLSDPVLLSFRLVRGYEISVVIGGINYIHSFYL